MGRPTAAVNLFLPQPDNTPSMAEDWGVHQQQDSASAEPDSEPGSQVCALLCFLLVCHLSYYANSTLNANLYYLVS